MSAHVAGGDERGCPLANAAVELPDKDHPARRVIEAFNTAQRNRLIQLCGAAALAEPEMLADELFLLLEGARVTAQSIGPKGLGARLVRMGEAEINAHTIIEPRVNLAFGRDERFAIRSGDLPQSAIMRIQVCISRALRSRMITTDRLIRKCVFPYQLLLLRRLLPRSRSRVLSENSCLLKSSSGVHRQFARNHAKSMANLLRSASEQWASAP